MILISESAGIKKIETRILMLRNQIRTSVLRNVIFHLYRTAVGSKFVIILPPPNRKKSASWI